MVDPWPLGVSALLLTVAIAPLAGAALFRLGLIKMSHEAGRLTSLDGLRGYLSIFVLTSHFLVCWNYSISGHWLRPDSLVFSNIGSFAVFCFFIITGMLFHQRVVLAATKLNWFQIYISRFLRLIPMGMVTTALVTLVVFWVSDWQSKVSVYENVVAILSWSTTGLLGFPPINGYRDTHLITAGVLWTLRYEWIFYFSLPLLTLFRHLVANTRFRLIVLLISVLILNTVPFTVGPFRSVIASLFVIGMVIAECEKQPKFVRGCQSWIGSVIAVIALLGALCINETPYSTSLIIWAFVFMFPIALGNNLFGVLNWRGSRALGEISYSVYLLHGIWIFILFKICRPLEVLSASAVWVLMPMSALVVIAASAITYKFVELRGMELARRLKSRNYERPSVSRQVGLS